MSIHNVEQNPRGARVLHDHIARTKRVVKAADLLELQDQAVLMDNAFRRTSRAGGITYHQGRVEWYAIESKFVGGRSFGQKRRYRRKVRGWMFNRDNIDQGLGLQTIYNVFELDQYRRALAL